MKTPRGCNVCAQREDQAEPPVGQVLGFNVSEHGAGGYVAKGDLAALDQLVDEQESQLSLIHI